MSELIEREDISVEDGCAGLMWAELNHRVGNELAAALAALRIARRMLHGTAEHKRHLDAVIVRLENFGQVHAILDPRRSNGTVAQRLEALCAAISVSKAAPAQVHLALTASDVDVGEETAWTICVVASELLTNALKHAFSQDETGLIIVDLHEEQGSVVLSVADNGIGVSVGRSRPRPPFLPNTGAGWSIIAGLADRIGGTVTCGSRSSGTTATLQIPLRSRALVR